MHGRIPIRKPINVIVFGANVSGKYVTSLLAKGLYTYLYIKALSPPIYL